MPWAGKCLFIVVIATLSNEKLTVFNSIYQTIFFIDSATEESLEVSLQNFRVADSFHRAISVDILYESVDAPEGLFLQGATCRPKGTSLGGFFQPECVQAHTTRNSTCSD